jgi:hypothetical protein
MSLFSGRTKTILLPFGAFCTLAVTAARLRLLNIDGDFTQIAIYEPNSNGYHPVKMVGTDWQNPVILEVLPTIIEQLGFDTEPYYF